jgi:hypothetical protein
MDFAAGVYLSETLFPPRFLFGGRLASLQVLNMVRHRVLNCAEYGLQQDSTPPTPSQPHTVSIYCTSTQGGGGGDLHQRESWTGNNHKAGWQNTSRTDCISSL